MPSSPGISPAVSAAAHCIYPQSNPTNVPIGDAINRLVANRHDCASFYLDTREGQSNGVFESEEHHQGLARTHKLSDGSVYFFLSHSELDSGDKGIIMQFKYSGPLDGEHISQPDSKKTVARLKQLLFINEQHPSDIEFLADVNNNDAGYLFVTQEYKEFSVAIYYWEPGHDLMLIGNIPFSIKAFGPNFIFADKVDDRYYLGIATNHVKKGILYSAKTTDLFPKCEKGSMNVNAFKTILPDDEFDFPIGTEASHSPSQVKLIKDSTGQWYLLAYRSDDNGNENSKDFIDVYSVNISPFKIGKAPVSSTHIYLPTGDTSFTNTGTHHVEKGGRLLVSSSYRWSEDEGHGAGFVSRVDECAS